MFPIIAPRVKPEGDNYTENNFGPLALVWNAAVNLRVLHCPLELILQIEPTIIKSWDKTLMTWSYQIGQLLKRQLPLI